jgi:hypothetical protein
MDRITLKLVTKSKLQLDNHHVHLKGNYRRLNLVGLNFLKPINDKLFDVLSTIKHLSLSRCTLKKWNVNPTFQQIFDTCHSLETLQIYDLRINISGQPAQKRVKCSVNSDSIGSVKYLNIIIEENDNALSFFEEFQPLNVEVETLALEFFEEENYNYDQLIELFKMLQQSYEPALKELIVGMNMNDKQFEEFISLLTKKKEMRLRVFELKTQKHQQNHQELIAQFIKQQNTLHTLKFDISINRELFELLTEQLINLKDLKIRINPNTDGKYVIEHLHKFQTLKKLTINVHQWFKYEVIPTLKLDFLKNLEHFKFTNEETNLEEDEVSEDDILEVELSSSLNNLKSFSFKNIASDAFTLQKIFEYMPNLEVLELKRSFLVIFLFFLLLIKQKNNFSLLFAGNRL